MGAHEVREIVDRLRARLDAIWLADEFDAAAFVQTEDWLRRAVRLLEVTGAYENRVTGWVRRR